MKCDWTKDEMIFNMNLNKINLNTFEDYELDYYDDYCHFVRRKFLDEVLKLPDTYLDRVSIDDISSTYTEINGKKTIDGNIKALILFRPDCNSINTETYIFNTIGFIKWLKMLRRDKKLGDLGI